MAESFPELRNFRWLASFRPWGNIVEKDGIDPYTAFHRANETNVSRTLFEGVVVARWALLVSSDDPVLLLTAQQEGFRICRGLDRETETSAPNSIDC